MTAPPSPPPRSPGEALLPCLALAGPTASGKTAAALAIAAAFANEWPVEIVSVDSALVYRGMDIGTAKPTAAERAAVPHHLIDILDPSEAYSAARFVADATRVIAAIHGRGHLPLLVGGTMLYFKALFDGLDAMPGADPAVRAAIDAQAARDGWPALHVELTRVDPLTAARLAPGDAQRIQRALEVHRVSGRTLSSFHAARAPTTAAWPPLVSLEPGCRSWLHERIDQRFRHMLAAGLLDEVQALRRRGDLHPGLPAMRCIGYRQAWEALDTGQVDALAQRGAVATRQLAKRQMTWLRSVPMRMIVRCDLPSTTAQVLKTACRARLQLGEKREKTLIRGCYASRNVT